MQKMDGEASSIAVLFFHRGVIPFGSPLATVHEQDNPSASCMRCRGLRVLAFPSAVRLSTTETRHEPRDICTYRPANLTKDGGIPIGCPFATNNGGIYKTISNSRSSLLKLPTIQCPNCVLRLVECTVCSIEYSQDGI